MRIVEKVRGRSLAELRHMSWLKFKQITGWRSWKHFKRGLAQRLAVIPIRGLKEPIFLVGCARSGTTVFMNLYGLHSDVAMWYGEAAEVWDPNAWDYDADHARQPEDVTKEDKRRIESVFQWYRLLSGNKPRFANRMTLYAINIPYMKAMFPDAHFVYIYRDGRAVASSIVNAIRQVSSRSLWPMGRFTKPPNWRDLLSDDLVEQSAGQWLAVVEVAERDIARRPPGEILRVRYEDLCADPRATVSRAWQHAGLSIDHKALEAIPPRLENRNVKWRRDRTPEEIETMHRVLAAKLIELGYEQDENWD
jgi:hypothetical protein